MKIFKQHRYPIFVAAIYFASAEFVAGQIKDTVPLNEIIISTVKAEKFTAGKKNQKIDSLTLQNFANSNLSELLTYNSSVFMKNYGPGNISTSSLRGGNSSQTGVLWNGFNIQNPMLGQNDFSQIPNFIFDNVAIEYGGTAALWGSGAIGGNIQLNNKAKFNRGFTTLLNVGAGSYNTLKLNAGIHYSDAKFSTNTKVYLNKSENNFNFINVSEKSQTHSDYNIKGFLQEISYLFLDRQKITARAWYNKSFRNYSPTLGNSIGKSSQEDENLKITADWISEGKKITPAIRFAYFEDVLNYTDSIANIFSNNKTKTLITEGDVYYKINNNHKIYLGLNYTNYQATTSNYSSSQHELSKTAFLLGYNLNLLKNKLFFDLNLRQEISSAYNIPFTGSGGISYQIIKQIKIKVNAAKVYRLPTLNDLYWKTGGNPNLKPEDGYTYEGGLDFALPIKKFILQTELTYFGKQINNWINWVPGPNSFPTPLNVLLVYSRGTESSSSLTYLNKNMKIKLGINTTYVLSTSVSSALPNDAAVDKQLVYTPRYNYGANISISIYDFSIQYFHNYVGYRYTSSDNTTWLTPYDVGNLKVAYVFKMKPVSFLTTIHINNLFNTDYKIIEQRPMPLRNYEISITLIYNKPNKNKII